MKRFTKRSGNGGCSILQLSADIRSMRLYRRLAMEDCRLKHFLPNMTDDPCFSRGFSGKLAFRKNSIPGGYR